MNRTLFSAIAALAFTAILSSCGANGSQAPSGPVDVQPSYEVSGVKFDMLEIPGAAFTMGAQKDHRRIAGAAAFHEVVLSGYAISKYPVSQKLWEAVMGSNPSAVKGDNYPVDRVTLADCKKFAAKLSKLTGVPFILPTEAQWEYAATSGVITPVKNLKEWVSDVYADAPYDKLQVDPQGPAKGEDIVIRDLAHRDPMSLHSKAGGVSFRVAVRTGKAVPEGIQALFVDQAPARENVCSNETVTVGSVKFNMVAIKGGTFNMGGTPEQGSFPGEDEKPVHEVTVEDFEIGQTEVTAGLWKEVMGYLPLGNDEKKLNRPVINISWYYANEFILKLNEMTGRKFRLPTEAEWEYAARGGSKSRKNRYAGAGSPMPVAVYGENSVHQEVGDVRSKIANEAGLYDMSGNAWEWCQDRYAKYNETPEVDTEFHVLRGGSAASRGDACRVSNRSKIPATSIKGTFGFRLAL